MSFTRQPNKPRLVDRVPEPLASVMRFAFLFWKKFYSLRGASFSQETEDEVVLLSYRDVLCLFASFSYLSLAAFSLRL